MYRALIAFLVATTSLAAACGADQELGCTADAQCRSGRYCDLDINTCVGGVAPAGGGDARITVTEVQDPPAQVSGSATRSASEFVGRWALKANGEIKSQRGGTTSYQYDEDWVVEISLGTDHDLLVAFDVATIPALANCDADADLSGDGFLMRGGPCRADGVRMDNLNGSGYFDGFGELTVDVYTLGETLATGNDTRGTFTTSGVPTD